MQNWSPEPFLPTAEPAPPPAQPDREDSFRSEFEGDGEAHVFRREAGFNDRATILEHMSRREREVVFELVEIDVAESYRQREEDLRRELEEKYAADLASVVETAGSWAKKFTSHRDERLREMAVASARLAVELAGKILRTDLAADPEILVRTIQSALLMSGEADRLTVTVAPEDAVWLEGQAELRDRLGIERVIADRRISRGGCRIASAGREWNATLEGQLATLGEVVEEWIATEGRDGAGPADDDGKDPGEPAVE